MYLTLSSSMSAFSNLRFRICGSVERAHSWAARVGGDGAGERVSITNHHHIPVSHLVRIVFLQQRLELFQRHIDACPSLLLHQRLGNLWMSDCYRAGPQPSHPLPPLPPSWQAPNSEPFRTPDLAESAGRTTRAALGLGLRAHAVVSVPSGGGTAFIGAPRLHVNEAILDSRNPEGEGTRGGGTLGKAPSPGLASRTPPPSQGTPFTSQSFLYPFCPHHFPSLGSPPMPITSMPCPVPVSLGSGPGHQILLPSPCYSCLRALWGVLTGGSMGPASFEPR